LEERVRNTLENGPVIGPPVAPGLPPQGLNPEQVTERPILGFSAEERTRDGVTGVFVQGLTPGSAAEQAGLQPGDQVIQLGDTPVNTIDDVTLWISKHQVGDTVAVQLRRNGQPIQTSATLQANPAILARPLLPGLPAPVGTPPVAPPPVETAPHGRMGVVVEDASPDPARRRARVANVVPDSPAATVGIAVGDVIESVDGVPIASALDLQRRMQQTMPGQTVDVVVTRDGQMLQLRFALMGNRVPEERGRNPTMEPSGQDPAQARQPGELDDIEPPSMPSQPGDTNPTPPAASNPGIAPELPRPAAKDAEAGDVLQELRRQIEALQKRVAELEAKESP